jgi:hypothetical protein
VRAKRILKGIVIECEGITFISVLPVETNVVLVLDLIFCFCSLSSAGQLLSYVLLEQSLAMII